MAMSDADLIEKLERLHLRLPEGLWFKILERTKERTAVICRETIGDADESAHATEIGQMISVDIADFITTIHNNFSAIMKCAKQGVSQQKGTEYAVSESKEIRINPTNVKQPR